MPGAALALGDTVVNREGVTSPHGDYVLVGESVSKSDFYCLCSEGYKAGEKMARDGDGGGQILYLCRSGKSSEEVTFQVELKPEWLVIPGGKRAQGKGPRKNELGTGLGLEGKPAKHSWNIEDRSEWSGRLKRAGALLAMVRSEEIVLIALGKMAR